jgi:hypothetical protein
MKQARGLERARGRPAAQHDNGIGFGQGVADNPDTGRSAQQRRAEDIADGEQRAQHEQRYKDAFEPFQHY